MRKYLNNKAIPILKKIGKYFSAIILLAIVLFISREIYIYFAKFPERTGFVSYYDQSGEFPPAKTLWDFFQLLIIPLVLSIGGFFLNRAEKSREIQSQEQRHKTDLEIADFRRKQDQENIAEQQRSSTLQQYLDDISVLILKESLNKETNHEAPVIQIARVKTLTALRILENDTKRMDLIFQFLRDSGLAEFLLSKTTFGKINLQHANLNSINISKSNFSDAELSNTKLINAKCVETNFSHAVLNRAWLYHTKLYGADFFQAELIGAVLTASDLENATLIGANLSKADFTYANLRNANLQNVNFSNAVFADTDFSGAKLSQSDFSNANLGEYLRGIKLPKPIIPRITKFTNADLSYASFVDADMSLVDLTNANLKDADFTNAKISANQLKLAQSLENVTLPNGKKYENPESLSGL